MAKVPDHLEIEIKLNALFSPQVEQLIAETFARPMPSFYIRKRTWKEREAEAIYARALRRRIPRAFRRYRDALRYRLAHAIYPFDEGDDD